MLVQVDSLVRELQGFLADHRDAVVLENGGVAFDLDRARYSISSEHGKCLLHLWSEERNAVRRVLDLDRRNGVMRLAVLRFGANPTIHPGNLLGTRSAHAHGPEGGA